MLLTLLLGVLIVIFFIYLKGRYNQNYWESLGVPFYTKNKAGGPFWQFIVGKKALFEIFSDIYNDFENVPAVGIGSFFGKALYVKDPVNVHHIMQADFNSFNDRGIPVIDEDLLANNILFINGAKWKLLRSKFTPLFTSAKLKKMYFIIDKSAQDFIEFLKLNPDMLKGNAQQIYNTITHFSTAALSASVFGIETESTFDSPFRDMVIHAVKPSTSTNMKFAIGGISENLYKALKLKLFGEHEQFFIRAVENIIRKCEEDEGYRNYFADLCLKLQKEGTMKDPDTNLLIEPSADVLAAQAFFFFIAGIETGTVTMFSAIMELGRHPDMLKRVHEEVDAVFKKYNYQLTYDAISEVEYLDRVFSESLRMYPPLGYLSRQCVRDTVLPIGNIPVKKGVKVFMPVYDFHYDPKYHANPEVFDPDRFLKVKEISDMTYLPFGKGNRLCMGSRYARIQILSGLMHFFRHYTVKTNVYEGGLKFERTPVQLRVKNVDIEFISRTSF